MVYDVAGAHRRHMLRILKSCYCSRGRFCALWALSRVNINSGVKSEAGRQRLALRHRVGYYAGNATLSHGKELSQ